MMRKITDFRTRLLSKIDIKGEDDCWIWLSPSLAGKGYGVLCKIVDGKKKQVYAHREILEMYKGPPPNTNSQALHSCDVIKCCNPKHLSWGTESRNRKEARDRLNNQGNQKLTLEQVENIKLDNRVSKVIAEEYGVHFDTILRIKSGRAWQP